MTPIPGACALIAALSASGLATDRFQFEGFLPAKQVARQKTLKALQDTSATLVFYEAPHRILGSLEDIETVLGSDRQVVLARELSKTFETFIDGSVAEVAATVAQDSNQQRGEMVLMVAGAESSKREIDPSVEQLMNLLMPHLPLKKAAAIAAEYTGLKKNQLYQWGLEQNR